MKKLVLFLATVIFLIGCVYLASPTPPTPDLDNSVRSDEPGDTWQHPEQKGFYTDKARAEVMSEMRSKFSIKILGITIPSLVLNYRPEESQELVRDQLPSYYLEEIVYPFRDSLFVNGWEPKNSPRFRNYLPKDIPVVTYKDVNYLSKVTLRPVTSPVWVRIVIWALIFPAIYLIYISLKRSVKHGKN